MKAKIALVVLAVILGSIINTVWLHEEPGDFVGELLILAVMAAVLLGSLALIDMRYRCISLRKACWIVASVVLVALVVHLTMSATLVPLKDDFRDHGGDRYWSVFEVVKARNETLREHGFVILGKWWHSDYSDSGSGYDSFCALYIWCPPAAHARWYPRTRDDFDPARGHLY